MTDDDAPPLADLMPWSAGPVRLGRAWPLSPDAAALKARWNRFTRAGREERASLMRPTRARGAGTAVAQLPGQRAPGGPLLAEEGPCPEPVRVLHAPFDEQWLIPDHRLIDTARPELWRVTDDRQLFLLDVPGAGPELPALLATSLLPGVTVPADAQPLTHRPGTVRPLYRRPGGQEPNLAPGLLAHLAGVLDRQVTAGDLADWLLATAVHAPRGCLAPLSSDAGLWQRGVDLGGRIRRLMVRGTGERPRLPGGRRPYVRASIPERPASIGYEPAEEALHLGEGRISPVPSAVWEVRAGPGRVLESWFARRVAAHGDEPLTALTPSAWPQARTTELLDLITVLALLTELRSEREELAGALAEGPTVRSGALRSAGVLPAPAALRRPASVLDHQEEGPGGQFALL